MASPPVQYAKTKDGKSIAYAVAGEGVTLIRLPVLWNHFSLHWDSGMLSDEFEALAARFRLVLYDSRGQGLSDRGLDDALTIEDYERDLEAVIAASGSGRFVLYGPSFRALLAIRYAVKWPERVLALVTWGYTDRVMAPFGPAMIDLAATDWDHFIEIVARLGFPTKDTDLVRRSHRETMTQADHVIQARVLRSASAEHLLSQVSVPTLVFGSHAGSRASPNEASARWLASGIPRARLLFFDGPAAGLDSVDGQAPPVVVAIEEFVRGLALPPDLRLNGLSHREIEVLRLVADGKSNQQIANQLVISLNTVRHHLTNIFNKTGAVNRADAVSFAHRNALV